MSDLADTIDDLICSFEGDGKTMDTLIMYLFCWALVGFVALAVGKYAYARIAGRAPGKTAEPEPSQPGVAGDRKQQQQHQQQSRGVPATPPVGRKRLGSKTAGRTSAAVAGIAAGLSAVPAAAAASRAFTPEQQQQASAYRHNQQQHHPRPPPVAAGNDPDAVRWTNGAFKWLYDAAAGGEPAVVEYLLGEWIAALNDYTRKSFTEVSQRPPPPPYSACCPGP